MKIVISYLEREYLSTRKTISSVFFKHIECNKTHKYISYSIKLLFKIYVFYLKKLVKNTQE